MFSPPGVLIGKRKQSQFLDGGKCTELKNEGAVL